MSVKVKVHFENHSQIIHEILTEAKTEVCIAVAWINFKVYLGLFEKLISSNIKLRIICSDCNANRSHQIQIDWLIGKGAKIKLLKMPNGRNHMHHKFAVVDDDTLINGSFNWSPNATKSFENLTVIKNCPNEARKFKEEFERLLKVKTASIKALQKVNKCKQKGCGGELFNILVFSEKYSKYYELTGDLVRVCNSCEEYSRVKEDIVNNQLPILLQSYNGAADEYEEDVLYGLIADQLSGYMNKKETVHAIGRVATGLDGFDNDYIQTNILWKNVFVGTRLPDCFEDKSFDVFYDNSYTL
ncbi:phospholipase D-like domain-containing protein [Pedobacter sp.]